MVVDLVLLEGKGRIYFPFPSHIYFAFSNQKVFKEIFFSLIFPSEKLYNTFLLEM